MSPKLPAVTGPQLIRLLKKDGWEIGRPAKHGLTLTKKFRERNKVTFISTRKRSLPDGTLQDILNQVGIDNDRLWDLIHKYKLK